MKIVSGISIIDHLDEIAAFLEHSNGVNVDEVLPLFNEMVFKPNAQFYSCVPGFNGDTIRVKISQIGSSFRQVRERQKEILEKFNDILSRFMREFPGIKLDFDIHLLFSLGCFTGMALPMDDKIYLLLGMDALTGLTENHLKGYLTHELFHIYHFQRCPAAAQAAEIAMRSMKMPPLWALLWTEGIACQAIRRVFPIIPEEELLDWKPLVEQCRPILSTLAAEARKLLSSDAISNISGFFYFPRQDRPDLPTGCGYYLGMRTAELMANKHSYDQLLNLPDEELFHSIDAELKVISE